MQERLENYEELLQNKFIVQTIISYISSPEYKDYELPSFIKTLLIAADLIDTPIRNK